MELDYTSTFEIDQKPNISLLMMSLPIGQNNYSTTKKKSYSLPILVMSSLYSALDNDSAKWVHPIRYDQSTMPKSLDLCF
jgi:hypothetical protein